MFYNFVINPIVLLYKWLYLSLFDLTGSYGISLLLMSVITFLVTSPFMRWAGRIQKNEKHIQDILKPQIDTIRSQSQGAEQHRRIANLYKSYAYHPAMAVRSVAGLAVQIPFLIAAYYMLSELPDIKGQSFLIINDLSKPDGLIGSINVLPILMTVINLMSACTTAAFARKDKLQAALIALLFLLLLYTAPSALLIFWTCNNLWGLLGNLWKPFAASHGLADLKLTVRGRTIPQWLYGFSYETYVITALTATFFIFVPIDIYLRNSNEFWFSLSDIIWMLLFCFTATTLLLSALAYLLKGKAKTFFICLLAGVALGLFLQSYIINIDYGVLDGRQIDWSSYRKQGIINALLWIMCIAVPYIIFKITRKDQTFKKTITRISFGLILIQIFTIIFLFSTTPVNKKNEYFLSTDKMFEMSAIENTIVFILDTFDAELFEELLITHPEWKKDFADFTYYPDTVGSYPATSGALPQILTGHWNDNSSMFRDYKKEAWNRSASFWEKIKSHNYKVHLFTNNLYVETNSKIVDNVVFGKKTTSSKNSLVLKFYKLALFRSMPGLLKKYFWIYSGDFDVFIDNAYRFDDIKFFNNLSNGLIIQNKNKCFKFYHLTGVHPPYTMNNKFERIAPGAIKIEEQALASMNIFFDFIGKMKELSLYEKSQILLMSDHGFTNWGRRPILLHKIPNSKSNEIIISNNPVSFSDIQASLLAGINEDYGGFGKPFSMQTTPNRVRRFMWYAMLPWLEGYAPTLWEFKVVGPANNYSSWIPTFNVFARKGKEDYKYKLGEIIGFNSGGNSNNYSCGWSNQEANYSWSDGSKASLLLKLIDYKKTDLKMNIELSPYLGKNLTHQNVDVIVNETKLTTWKVTQKDNFNAIIPKDILKNDNLLRITFLISNPTSPKENRVSSDPRKLGIAAYKLSVTNSE